MICETPMIQYLRLTRKMMQLDDDGLEAEADELRDHLDEIWKTFSQEEIDILNKEGASHTDLFCKRCACDPTVWYGMCECGQPADTKGGLVRRPKVVRIQQKSKVKNLMLKQLGFEDVTPEQRAWNMLSHQLYTINTDK